MAQLKEDEWPADREPTTQEQEVARDPVNNSKDPERQIGQKQGDSGIPEFVDEIP